MSNLYSDLAEVYEAMYETFIDYKTEYDFYSQHLNHHHKKSLLELGCGTGNLASHFIKNGYEYFGLDLSKAMLDIATRKEPNGKFSQGDMRTFQLENNVGATIMTGRTISYLVTNEDLRSTFAKVYENLEMGGIFCFDCIDANIFIPEIVEESKITHSATHNNTNYVRKANWFPNLSGGMDVKWEAKYYKKEENVLQLIGEETSIVRTFTKNELEIFLNLHNFKIKEIIQRPSYAFPTLVFVAQKDK